MEIKDEILRGQDAKRILNEPLYQEAFLLVKDGIVNAMSSSPMGDAETHNRLVISLQVLEQIKRQLQQVMETGQMAEIQVKEKKNFLQRVF